MSDGPDRLTWVCAQKVIDARIVLLLLPSALFTVKPIPTPRTAGKNRSLANPFGTYFDLAESKEYEH